MSATLSVCCLTSDPGARVAAIMRQLRPIASEIVVAVDSRIDPQRLGRYARAADRLLRYEFVDSALQALPWMARQCSGDWILLIDGDEVPSPGLLERIPRLIEAGEMFQYWMPCRWVYPDADSYIAQPPWHFTSPRLVRNDPTALWHAGVSHTPFQPVFPAEQIEEAIYHLSLVVDEVALRQAKIDRYLGIASSHSRDVIEVDVPAYYMPERDRRFGIEPVPVPEGDRAAIAEILGATGEELAGPPPNEVPLWTWEMIQRSWPRRQLAEEDCRGAIEPFEQAPRLQAGERRQLTVRVRNEGRETWPGMEREPWIRVAHRWRDGARARPGETNGDGKGWSATSLPASLAPGTQALVPLAVEAPRGPGERVLELELVHEDRLYGGTHRRFARTELALEVEPACADRI